MIVDIGIYDWLEIFIFWILKSCQDVDEGKEDLPGVLC